MIDLSKMCDALAAKIQQAGYGVWVEDGVSRSTNDKAVQQIIDAFSLQECIDGKKREVDLYAKQLRDRLFAGVSSTEVASWAVKIAEAKTVGTASVDAAGLAKEALARGITVAALAAKVQANAAQFADVEAQIAGIAGKHKDVIASFATFADIAGYDYTANWPAV